MYNAPELLEFNPTGRDRYRHKPTTLPVHGVTSALGRINMEALPGWYSKITSQYWLDEMPTSGRQEDWEEIHKLAKTEPKRVAKEAGKIGTEAHEHIETILQGRKLPEIKNPFVLNAVKAFQEWIKIRDFKPVYTERVVFSEKHWYAGTEDGEGHLDGIYTLMDWKTSSGFYDKMDLQTAAYQCAREEESGIDIAQRLILRLDKNTGKFYERIIPACDYPRDKAAFLACLELHKILKEKENDKSLR